MLLAVTLVVANPALAQSDTASCASDGAVSAAADNPGLVADCDTLLAGAGHAGRERDPQLVGEHSN